MSEIVNDGGLATPAEPKSKLRFLVPLALFIVLAGYFSRTFSLSSGKARKLITALAVPYIIFETSIVPRAPL